MATRKTIIRKALLGISLALVVVTAALWVMSYWVSLEVALGMEAPRCFAFVGYGFARLELRDDHPPYPPASVEWIKEPVPLDHLWAFQWWASPDKRKRLIDAPAWIPPVLLAVWSWFLARPLIEQRRRRRNNLCATCGYDLTGNVSGRCPECGEQIPIT